jgi:lipoprotein NlpD
MMRAGALLGSVGLALSLLAACTSQPVQAPVIERAPLGAGRPPQSPPAGARADAYYTVRRGDTLFSIALDHGLDYKDLAAWNNMDNPNRIRSGQQLRIKPPASTQEATVTVNPVTSSGSVEVHPLGAPASPGVAPPAPQPGTQASGKAGSAAGPAIAAGAILSEPVARKLPYSPENVALLQRSDAQSNPLPAVVPAPAPAPAAVPAPAPLQAPVGKPDAAVADDEDKVDWGWPLQGKIVAGFSEASNKGLDIAGKSGDPVVASAPGRVVYSGSGLRGYGKLVIIKHNKTYLSAYAHNSVILVKEGQSVVKGQKIAEVGSTDSDRPELHFEIRKLGKPVDPGKYLPPPS